jgi:hypothetical protein
VLQIGLVVADDLVGDRGAALFFLEIDGRAEHDLAVGVDRRRIDDLRSCKLAFDLLDAAFDEALLVLRGLVFGVLGQIALRARLGNRLDDRMTIDGLQARKLVAELLEAAPGEWNRRHEVVECSESK